jgi:hypothetical protein
LPSKANVKLTVEQRLTAEAHRRYLSDKIDHIKATDAAQLTLLCTWLIEIYLAKLNAASSAQRNDQYDLVLDELRQVTSKSRNLKPEIPNPTPVT